MTRLLGDLRSGTLGLLSLGVLVALLDGDAGLDDPNATEFTFSDLTARGDTFLGASDDPFLIQEKKQSFSIMN